MSADSLSRMSPVNEGDKITNERPHKTLSKGNELLSSLLHAAFCMLDVFRKLMISQPCWLLEQISDFRITKTECKIGRLSHDCIC